MGLFSRFENKMEDTLEGAAGKMFDAPISPVQIAKKAEKQMRRETMVGAGKQFAPTLYTVLVNPGDDERLFGYYPTLAGETETYLKAKAAEDGLAMDGTPLVRFVVDDGLKHGKFDVIAELVAAPIVAQLRQEELERYGIAPARAQQAPAPRHQAGQPPVRRASEHHVPAEAESGYGYGGNAYDAGAQSDRPDHGRVRARIVDTAYQRSYDLAGAHLTIGREGGNDIVVRDISASRRHAELTLEPQGVWVVSDRGSTNGTLVNGVPVTSQSLRDGDIVTIGKTDLEFIVE